jgi:hypothetical protein
MMLPTTEMTPELEKEFMEWAQRQEAPLRESALSLVESQHSEGWPLAAYLTKALLMLAPLLAEIRPNKKTKKNLSSYALMVFKTMAALMNANAGRPMSLIELMDTLEGSSPLRNAMTLFDLRILSLERAAHLAGLSQSEFLTELGKAGITPFQYTVEEVLAEAVA